MKNTLLLLLLLTLCNACHDKVTINNPPYTSTVTLKKMSDSSYILQAHSTVSGGENFTSDWPLDYPIYRFGHGDINGDGVTDIFAGVIKPTRFDSIPGKRIFIFKLFEGYIRPLWLGSRVGQPLEDFKVVEVEGECRVRTIELEQSGHFLVAEYKWHGFGLDFVRYLQREIPLQQAHELLEKQTTT